MNAKSKLRLVRNTLNIKEVNTMNEYGFIAHHGIKGQKWGVQNGPPYPIGSDGEPKGAHRHIVKSKLSDKQKKLLKTGAAVAGVGAAAGLATLAAGGAAIAITRNPALVTNALRTIGSKAVSTLGKAGIMTGKMAIQKLMKESPEIFEQAAKAAGGKLTGKEAKKLLKASDLSTILDKAIASGDKNQINKVIIDNIDKFKNNSKALGKAAPFVDDAIKDATKGLSKKALDNHPLKGVSLSTIQTQADAISKAAKAGSRQTRWGAKIAGVTGGLATGGIAVNSLTNAYNDINRAYNTKNTALSKDIKKLISNALATKNHYDNYDEKERRKK